jgi:hypothetical protein
MAAVLEGQGDEAAGSRFVEAEGGGVEGAPALDGGIEGAPALVGGVEGALALVDGVEGAPALVGGFEGAPALVGGFEGAPALVGDVAVEVDVAGGFVGAVEAMNAPGLAPYDLGYFSDTEEVVRSSVSPMVCY